MNINKEFKRFVTGAFIYTIISIIAIIYCYKYSYESPYEIASITNSYVNYSLLFWVVLIGFSLTKPAHTLMEKTSGIIQYIPYIFIFIPGIMGILSPIFIFSTQSSYPVVYILMTIISLSAIKFYKYELNHYQPELTKQKIIQYIYYIIYYKVIFYIVLIMIRMLDVFMYGVIIDISLLFILVAIIVVLNVMGFIMLVIYLVYTRGFGCQIQKL